MQDQSSLGGRAGAKPADNVKRLLASVLALCLGLPLGSCGQTAGFVADHWPHWAGGMPDDVPPRPGAPGYDEFIAHRQPVSAATPATSENANAPATPSSNGLLNDKDVARGGMY